MTQKNETLLDLSIKEDGQVSLKVKITDREQFTTVVGTLGQVAEEILKNKQNESEALVLSLVHDLNLDLNKLMIIDMAYKATNNGEQND